MSLTYTFRCTTCGMPYAFRPAICNVCKRSTDEVDKSRDDHAQDRIDARLDEREYGDRRDEARAEGLAVRRG